MIFVNLRFFVNFFKIIDFFKIFSKFFQNFKIDLFESKQFLFLELRKIAVKINTLDKPYHANVISRT